MTKTLGFFKWGGWNGISAIATCFAALAAIWGVYMANQIVREVIILKKVSPPFAVVSAEGKILYEEERLRQYQVEVAITHIPNYANNNPLFGWRYRIKFKKTPHVVLFLSQTGSVPEKKALSDKDFEVTFIGSGFGSPIVKSEFVMQVLEPSDKETETGIKHE